MSAITRRSALVWVTWILCSLTIPARAQSPRNPQPPSPQPPSPQPPSPQRSAAGQFPDHDRPWAVAVPAAEQTQALRLYQEGNASFDEYRFAAAAAAYREALTHWSHPGIHYNLAKTLRGLDEWLSQENTIEVYEHICHALAYGPMALEAETYTEAQRIKQLMEERIARVNVSCEQAGVSITLDGVALTGNSGAAFACPGRTAKILLPGKHILVASRPGYFTETRHMDLFPGTEANVSLHLYTPSEVEVTKRHWSAWKPWSVVGAGVAVGSLGGLLHWNSKQAFGKFDSKFATVCPTGCADDAAESPIAALPPLRWRRNVGIGGYVVAAMAVSVGLTMVIFNRPRTFRTYEPSLFEEVPVTPIVSDDEVGVVTSFIF